MNWIVMTCLIAVIPQPDVLVDRVDVIELNHVYSDEGDHCFSQFIFWDWSPSRRCWVCRAWMMAKGQTLIGRELVFVDDHVFRKVVATARRETWTQYDPEQDNLKILCKDNRRGLARWSLQIAEKGHNR